MRRADQILIGCCFFLSGATSLILEVAWTKQLSYILGNTLYAVSTGVGAFMAGLALGSVTASRWAGRVRNPILLYGALQIGIGLFGFTLVHVFGASGPLFAAIYRSLGPGGAPFLLVRFAVVFILLLLPTTLMGMTLPVMVGAFARRVRAYELQAGLLYGANTVGAVGGTLLAGFALLPLLGIRGTCLLAGATDVAIACAALVIARRLPGEAEVPDRPISADSSGWNARQWRIAVLYGISGIAALVYEVAWFRLCGLTVGPSVYAFSAVLGVYLAGIGIGSAVLSSIFRRSRWSGLRGMAVLEIAIGLITLLQLYGFNALPRLHRALYQWAVSVTPGGGFAVAFLLLSAVVVFVPCLLLGALFPMTAQAVREARGRTPPETHIGRLYLLNTAGSIAGSLAAGFLLLPRAGLWATLGIASFTSLALGAVFALQNAEVPKRTRWAYALVPLALGATLLAARPPWDIGLFNLGPYRETYSGESQRSGMARSGGAQPSGETSGQELIFYKEGVNCPVAVYRTNGNATLFVSGKPDAGLGRSDQQTQLLLGQLPVSLASHPERVAMVGCGCGMTAAAILAHAEVKHLDVIEIEKGVIEASRFFECVNHDPFSDPRTRLVLEDGRVHLSYTDQQYDVIVSEPSNPWMAGIANLFTVDFYTLARAHLSPGGVFCQWFQEYEITEESFRAMLASLQEAFPHVLLFQPTPGDFIAVASEREISIPWETFRGRFEEARSEETYARIGILNPLQLGFFFQGCQSILRDYANGAKVRNTDDNVWLEYRLPRELMGRTPRPTEVGAFGRKLSRLGSRCRVREWTRLIPGIPLIPFLQETVLYPYGIDPSPAGMPDDPWRDVRGELASGLFGELREMGRDDLAAEAKHWDAQGREYMNDRRDVYERLRGVSRRVVDPSPELFSWALDRASDLPYLHAMLGDLASQAEEFDVAEAHYRQVLRSPSGLPYYDALLGIAGCEMARGNPRQASNQCRQAISWNPYFTKAYVLLSEISEGQGDREGSKQIVLEGLRYNPSDADLHSRLTRGQ